ncbi:unnamed protein product [Paramecium pentaurelia]|uniref:Uncharacterized protein n=1 Tax=Paramecium pentaurelia TaxID=43138 RepID=A0A8S1YKA0_9CILI|nr:unnamed protein product [Paramecium pentaurelia]
MQQGRQNKEDVQPNKKQEFLYFRSEINQNINDQQMNQGNFEQNVKAWNNLRQRLIYTKIQIKYTQDQEIQYIRDGSIIRSEKIYDPSQKIEIFTNLEQLQNLQWTGQYGKEKQKVGVWNAYWKGNQIKDIGGEYSEKGKKMVNGKNQILIFGQKHKFMKLENMKMDQGKVDGNQCIIVKGGGEYNQFGERHGQWIELWEEFWDRFQVMFQGAYKNGKKVSKWEIEYQGSLIGGGSYDEEGQEIKIGKWTELDEEFSYEKKVVHIGFYKNEKKVGRWEIMYERSQIGGGLYDEGGSGAKNGKWIELDEKFNWNNQLSYQGEYKYDKKVGRWEIQFQGCQIAGGLYDEKGCEVKIGQWLDLDQGFDNQKQVIHKGLYENGKKVGRWDTKYREYNDNEFKIISWGCYDKEGYGIKIGQWVDLDEKFCYEKQVIHNGLYKNGKKVGRWEIQYRQYNQQDFKTIQLKSSNNDWDSDVKLAKTMKIGWLKEMEEIFLYSNQKIPNNQYNDSQNMGNTLEKRNLSNVKEYKIISGGGSYDEKGNEVKIGKWIDFDVEFNFFKQLIYIGEYDNGKKIGLWKTMDKQSIIVSQNYDANGQLIYESKGDCISVGEFKNGKKIGRWDFEFKRFKIGGGSYDEEGNGFKIGKWIELDVDFQYSKQLIYNGVYNDGKKFGRWDTQYRQYNSCDFKIIGGGSYGEGAGDIKIGMWIELDDGLENYKKIVYYGEYLNGKKNGIWQIKYEGTQIGNSGGGSYYEGIKIRKWIDLDDNYGVGFRQQYLIHQGEYKNGKKIGLWVEMKRNKKNECDKIMKQKVY